MSSSTEPRMRVRSNSSSVRSTSPYPSSSSFTASSARPTIKTPPSSSSAWQQLVVHASSAAGSTAAVISEESMKCLKYCLSWLQYAMRHIEQQMNVLRDFLVSLASSQQQQQHSLAPHHPNNNMHRSHLSSIKKDIVDTLRKVVDVISRYASNSLPHQAKMAVRGFILDLPGRCATLSDIRSTATSPAASPLLTPTNEGLPQEQTAIRLLTFGQESVDMLQSVSVVFSDTVDRAELWLDKLRSVRGTNNPQACDNTENNS
ncbi:opi1-domain-containing protein [Lichtheimia corymbifera JMRC:FSU:9682]|uniref:Opi1-domain-containing protein n=1 Tax=Lichtheimia corymbifera JMRC:FSU:9682 TaxID=1263082 RepID=A0A068RH61_9FUNG|nr:opi1-domain-containing protein [Lichtheimia corymbifera JMRC:FSU:9682]